MYANISLFPLPHSVAGDVMEIIVIGIFSLISFIVGTCYGSLFAVREKIAVKSNAMKKKIEKINFISDMFIDTRKGVKKKK